MLVKSACFSAEANLATLRKLKMLNTRNLFSGNNTKNKAKSMRISTALYPYSASIFGKIRFNSKKNLHFEILKYFILPNKPKFYPVSRSFNIFANISKTSITANLARLKNTTSDESHVKMWKS